MIGNTTSCITEAIDSVNRKCNNFNSDIVKKNKVFRQNVHFKNKIQILGRIKSRILTKLSFRTNNQNYSTELAITYS